MGSLDKFYCLLANPVLMTSFLGIWHCLFYIVLSFGALGEILNQMKKTHLIY